MLQAITYTHPTNPPPTSHPNPHPTPTPTDAYLPVARRHRRRREHIHLIHDQHLQVRLRALLLDQRGQAVHARQTPLIDDWPGRQWRG